MYTEKVEAWLRSIVPGMGYELDSVTFTKEDNEYYLRAFIMKADGSDMTVNDCAAVSRRLSKWLDKEDFIPEQYMLEVCSVGFKDQPQNINLEENEDIEGESSAASESAGTADNTEETDHKE